MRWLTIVLATMLVLVPGPVAAVGGGLDPTFSEDGKVLTRFRGNAYANDMAIQADGKIVAVGMAYGDFAVARYRTDGSLDPSFGGDGRVRTGFADTAGAWGVAVQSDGKIVAAGWVISYPESRFALVRYRPDGSPDPSFSGDGRVITSFALSANAEAVAIQPDGRIVVVGGRINTPGVGERLALARYSPDGSLDPTFGGDGRVTTRMPSGDGYASDVAIQPDGKILASVCGANFSVARYRADGTLDGDFGEAGIATAFIGGCVEAVTVAQDGRITVAGHTVRPYLGKGVFALSRFEADGSPDLTFGGIGAVNTAFRGDAEGMDLAIQADAKVVVAGYEFLGATGTDWRFAVARYGADGSLDTSFGGDGKVTTRVAGASYADAVAVQADGRIVVTGSGDLEEGSDPSFALVRYMAA